MRFRGGEGERPHSTNCLGSPPLSPSITNNIHLGYVYIASCPRHDPSHPVHELTHYASVLEQLMHGVVSFATSSHRS